MGRVVRNPFAVVLCGGRRFAEGLTRWGADPEEDSVVESLSESIEAWASRHLDPLEIDRRGAIPADALRSAGELGLFGVTTPERFGGSALSMKAACRTIDRIAQHDTSSAISVGLHIGLGVRALVEFGSEELRRAYLPDLAAGRKLAAMAVTEAGAGSDLASMRTIARRCADGTLRLSGSKAFVTNGGLADVFTVAAATPELGGRGHGHSLLLVERDAPGLRVGREERKLGIRGSSTTALHLDDVRLPPDRVIGEPGRGLSQLHQVFSWGRTVMAAGCLGGARSAARLAASHVLSRRQFGRPLAGFGQVREKIARMDAGLFAMESLVRLTAALGSASDTDLGWESAVTKCFCSERASEVVDDALQLHGGSGFIEDTGISRLYRDVRVTRIFEGANEVLRFHLAASALLFPFDAPEAHPPLASLVGPELLEEASAFDALYRRLQRTLDLLLERHGSALFERQLLLGGLADALIGLFVLLSVILRAEGTRRRRPAERELLLARYLGLALSRRIAGGLEATGRELEERQVNAISDRVYASDARASGT